MSFVIHIIEQFCYNIYRTDWGDGMIIKIVPDSEIAIYIQLTNQIIEGIAKGYLKPGDTLPSVRALASDLGVNMHTVNKSYHELEKKGIIRIVPKSGAIINDYPKMNKETYERIYNEMKPLVAEAFVLSMSEDEINNLLKEIIKELKR